MAAAAATIENRNTNEADFLAWEQEKNHISLYDVTDIAPEVASIAERELQRQLGGLALLACDGGRNRLETDTTTLLSKLHEAKAGNESARVLCKTNVATDVAERLFKTAHQTSVGLQLEGGHLVQNGVRLIDVHKNTFKHMDLDEVMSERTTIECRNMIIFEELACSGVLDDYDAVVFSNTPVNPQTRKDYRFFTDTDSLSIQYLKKDGAGYVMETAMVAGKTSPVAERHDFAAVSALFNEQLVVDDNSMLQKIKLVPKSRSSGVHTIVEDIDNSLGGTFYGEAKPRQDYQAYRSICEQRTRDFDGIVESILTDLLAEAGQFTNPYQAIERLDELSDKYCINAAMSRKDIDARVFGQKAAGHIEDARFFNDIGDTNRAEQSLQKAADTSESSSCPLKLASQAESLSDANNKTELSSGKKRMTCPYCKERTVGDPCASEINCTNCSASTRHSSSKNYRLAREYKKQKRHNQKMKGILALWNKQTK